LQRHYGARLIGFPSSDDSWVEEDDSYCGLKVCLLFILLGAGL